MKLIKSLTAAALCVLLIGAAALPAFAESDPSEKEEVLYIMTDAGGGVTDVEAVNIFAGGNVVDYGDYSAVKALNTTDQIKQNNGRIAFFSDAEKVYYQGTLKNTTIPWNISIRYFLDGKEYSAKEIAGKSGTLEIRFRIEKNEACTGNFYESHALQASFSLDTERCKNITADGATIANVGSCKQLSYTILPGKGIDTVIRTDVTDFEMDAVTINGVRLNLNIEIDRCALMKQIDTLIDAVGAIDSGTGEVNRGTASLADAVGSLDTGTRALQTGVGSLTSGAERLYSGLSDIVGKNDLLTSSAYTAFEGLCSAASSALNPRLTENGLQPVALTPTNYSSLLLELLEKMDADTVYQQAYQTALQQVTQQVQAQADALYEGYIQSNADTVYQAYIASRADALYTKVAAQAVYEQLLQNGYNAEQANAYLQSDSGAQTVAQTVAAMTEEQKEQILARAVSELTPEQKKQILQGALQSMTEEQKTEIRQAYIEQKMTSDEVRAQLNAAVATVSASAEQICALKGQLDAYGAFYQGLSEYTEAVGNATAGAKSLKTNLAALYSNTGTLAASVTALNDGARKLTDGTQTLSDGTSAFVEKTSDLDTEIERKIDTMADSVTAKDLETESFVSARNTNVKSVQFVIKTAAIEKAETSTVAPQNKTVLTLWQKLLSLFGLYHQSDD